MDQHSEYLAKAIDGLTPEGHKRVDEVLAQLVEAAPDHEAVARFATTRKAEADVGRTEAPAAVSPGPALSRQEQDFLIAGFRTIRDQEPSDDVADWANAIVALLEDEADSSPSG